MIMEEKLKKESKEKKENEEIQTKKDAERNAKVSAIVQFVIWTSYIILATERVLVRELI